MSWIAGTLDDVEKIENWFVVDIGFSSNQASCGVKFLLANASDKTDEVDYANMIKKFREFISDIKPNQSGKKEFGLIIEAPLSISFSKSVPDRDGNPVGRFGIELQKRRDQSENTKTRYWYVGAGAAVTLSVIQFLNEIKILLQNDVQVYIYEGLLSFKEPGAQSHAQDAEDLYDAIIALAKQRPEAKSILDDTQTLENTNIKFIGDYLGIKLEKNGIPYVINVDKRINAEEPFSLYTHKNIK